MRVFFCYKKINLHFKFEKFSHKCGYVYYIQINYHFSNYAKYFNNNYKNKYIENKIFSSITGTLFNSIKGPLWVFFFEFQVYLNQLIIL